MEMVCGRLQGPGEQFSSASTCVGRLDVQHLDNKVLEICEMFDCQDAAVDDLSGIGRSGSSGGDGPHDGPHI